MKENELFSWRQTWQIAFAYVGVLTGAGLATGREMLQYFVSYGRLGLFGLVAITLLHMLFAKWIFTLGSYYKTSHHMEALRAISSPAMAKLLDASLVFACFVMSFVLIAGAGANLNQQYGVPTWIGALVCALSILIVSFMDFKKVTTALGMFTPVILSLLAIGIVSIMMGPSIDWQAQFDYAASVPTPLATIYLSVINYFALCLMSSTSMLFVLGGNIQGLQNAERGGILGGLLTGIVSISASIILYSHIDQVAYTAVPMLSFMNHLHPLLGHVMFLVVFGMIFNSGMSVCYSMAKRVANGNKARFHWTIAGIVSLAFALSFVGFEHLMTVLYPILGYTGILLFVTIAIAWYKDRHKVNEEKAIRTEIFELIQQKRVEEQQLTHGEQERIDQLITQSIADNHVLRRQIAEYMNE